MNKRNKLIAVFSIVAIAFGIFYYQHSKVRTIDVLVGIGNEAKVGQTAVFDYRGFIYEPKAIQGLGKEFDSTYRRHQAMRAVIGQQQVIPGLDKALVGMKPGGQRTVLIDSSMAYGSKGAGDGLVPADTKVIYHIELRSLEN